MSINLCRIDDRLIHGQVVTQWVNRSGANRIVIIDDGVAKDPFMCNVVKMLAPVGTKVEVYSVADGIEPLTKYSESADIKVLILVKIPQSVLGLVEGGVPIKEMIVGGMGKREGRTVLYRNITADEEERACMRTLIDKGVHVVCQIVPDQKGEEAAPLLK